MTGIAAIENAMLERLRLAGEQDVLGYRFRTLESYPEDFDLYLKEKIKGDRAFPAAWAVFGGWRRVTDQASTVDVEAVFMMVVAAQNLRNETAQRHGAGDKEVGSYQLLIDVAQLLHGQRLGLDIGQLKLGPCRSVRPDQTIKDRQLSVYALEFAVAMPIEVGQSFGPAGLGDFSTFNANWDLPPIGGVDADADAPGVQLPADAQADATDKLELPQ